MTYALRDAITLDGIRPGRIVGKSALDFNVELDNGAIKANVEADRLKPRAVARATMRGVSGEW